MQIIADLHIHSRFSRACSKDITIKNLEKYAKIKGINLLGTGDFTHPLWLKELKQELKEDDSGILKTQSGFQFILQTEVSNFFQQAGKPRKIHNVILAKNFDVITQINELFSKHGKLSSDGRPMFASYPCVDMVEDLMEIDKSIEIIPAHCLVPEEKIICNPKPKKISEVKEGEKVLTHTGNYKRISKIFKRGYNGQIYKIQPYYFTEGIKVTNEHPFFAIKTIKDCSYVGGLCKPNSTIKGKHKCRKAHYLDYKPQWITAENLEINDVLLYPRIKKIEDKNTIKISEVITGDYRFYNDYLVPKTGRQDKKIKNIIKINSDFCRLIGYYLAEGYITEKNNCLQFCFGPKEHEYITDVIHLMRNTLSIEIGKKRERNGYELFFYSKPIVQLFKRLFYEENKPKTAPYKKLPDWAIYLPLAKQVEIFRGWWRGDTGVTTSETLSMQMKLICLRLGIIPSINITSKEYTNKRNNIIGNRKIKASYDAHIFHNLSFYEDNFNLLNEFPFKKFKTKLQRRHGWIDENYIYIPIKEIETRGYSGLVYNLEVEEDNSFVTNAATVHNCMTPWFGIFGSNSGFNSLEECFLDKTKYIHAVETGMSADPKMLWRLSFLDKTTLISNSDSHSFWPWRLGREANLFDIEPNYNNIIHAIRTKQGLKATIEVDPSYGKYHFDGHRLCNISFSPQESIKHSNICPKCKRPLTIGVAHRIEELAARKEGYKTLEAVPFYSLIPLNDLISIHYKTSQISKKTWEIYNKLMQNFQSEFNILLNAEESEIIKITDSKFASIIILNRQGKIQVKPGYDGVYGIPIIEGVEHKIGNDDSIKIETKQQKSLTDF